MSKRAEQQALKAYPRSKEYTFSQRLITNDMRDGFIHGYEQAEKELTPLINRLCEAILFEWKDAADLARKTLIQIKEREEEK